MTAFLEFFRDLSLQKSNLQQPNHQDEVKSDGIVFSNDEAQIEKFGDKIPIKFSDKKG